MKRILRFIRHTFRDSFFAKTVLLYSTITAVSLIALGVIVNTIVSDTLIRKELDYNAQAINSMGGYIRDREEQFGGFIFNNTDKRYSDILTYLTSGGGDSTIDKSVITNYLNSMLNSSPDILDVILCRDSDGDTIGCTKEMRLFNTEYAFAQKPWYQGIKANAGEISILKPCAPDYIRYSNEKVLTYASNIEKNIYPSKKQDIGTLIVDYDFSGFEKVSANYKSLKGSLLVMARDGTVYFDSKGHGDGEQLPYFDKILGSGNRFRFGNISYISIADRTALANYILASVVPEEEILSEVNGVMRLFYISIAGLMVLSVTITIAASRKISVRVQRITNAMKKSEAGSLDNRIETNGHDELDTIAECFNKMSRKLGEYIEQAYLSRIMQKSAELSALQSQINPHFLFNTLETLRMESVTCGCETVAQMLMILGNIFRWNLKNKENVVTVSQEIQYAEYYLELQKYRMKDRLEYSVRVDPSILDFHILKFMLQPILENAVQHGLSGKDKGGSVEIAGFMDGGRVVFTITDDGMGFDPQELSRIARELEADVDLGAEKIGLKNVSDRIRILFGGDYKLTIQSKPGNTVVTVSMPLLDGDTVA